MLFLILILIGFKFTSEGSLTPVAENLAGLFFLRHLNWFRRIGLNWLELVSGNLQSSDALWLHGVSFLVKPRGGTDL